MDPIEIMKRPAPYASGHENAPAAAQLRAKRLCWEYNRTAPDEAERRGEILRELLGTCDPLTFIEPDFRCDYGFNIHTHGLTIVNSTHPPSTSARARSSRRASVWPVRGTPSTRRSAPWASAPPPPSRSDATSGSARTPPSAAA